ncbi:MAG: IS1595 family transposase [Cyclobacteriaceae bacterium]
MNFKSLPQLLDFFKDEQVGIEYYEQIRWNGEVGCPHCGCVKPYKTKRGYRCSDKDCKKDFTVRTGTIFQDTKIPFRIWFAAIYLATTSSKGISSVQLSVQLGITQKSAWHVLHRIREMLKEKAPKMLGENNMVEGDETYVGGLEKNKHYDKKRSDENPDFRNNGEPYKAKKVVVGLIERNGKVVLKHIPSASKSNMVEFISKHVPAGSKIYTDESKVYSKIGKNYDHKSVNHGFKVYVAGSVHTNTIESFWATLKRGLYGIYHQVSDKHLERYLDEFAARYNTRGVTPQDKFDSFLNQSDNTLTYERLVRG